MSITPKLHILITHVKQWVDIFGKEGEQSGEAVHHIWRRLLESLGEPKKKESPAWVKFISKALLMFNASNKATKQQSDVQRFVQQDLPLFEAQRFASRSHSKRGENL